MSISNIKNNLPNSVYLLVLFLSVSAAYASDSNWNLSALNTGSNASYLSPFEKEIILEINKMRSNPSQYAEDYLVPLEKYYDRRILYYPGDQPLLTREGVFALKECIRVLKKQEPLPVMYPSRGLTKAANDHVEDQSETGKTGHVGNDKSNMRERIERYGTWQLRIAENIAYGAKTARQVVIYLLIDDGVRDRGHRRNFLTPEFKTVGVAVGQHPGYGNMSVMNFAGGFKDAGN